MQMGKGDSYVREGLELLKEEKKRGEEMLCSNEAQVKDEVDGRKHVLQP